MSEKGFRIEVPLHLKRDRRARKVVANGEAPEVREPVPRIARLLALAHKWEAMARRGEIKNHTDLACRTKLTVARISQIANLIFLSPDIQDQVLHSEDLTVPSEHQLRHLVAPPLWDDQHRTWDVVADRGISK